MLGTPATNTKAKADASLMSYQEEEVVEELNNAPKYKEPGPHCPDPLEQSSSLVPANYTTPAPRSSKPKEVPKTRPMPKNRPKPTRVVPKKRVGFHPAQNLDFSNATSEEEPPVSETSPPFHGFATPVVSAKAGQLDTSFCPTVHSTPAVVPRARTVTPSWPVKRPTHPKNPKMRMLPARLTDAQYQRQKMDERRHRRRQIPRHLEDYDLEDMISDDDSTP